VSEQKFKEQLHVSDQEHSLTSASEASVQNNKRTFSERGKNSEKRSAKPETRQNPKQDDTEVEEPNRKRA